MDHEAIYPIGTPGRKWGAAEKVQWFEKQRIRRSYDEEVVRKLEPLKKQFKVKQYGKLPYPGLDYPLFAVHVSGLDDKRPNVLVTGGVHGYETSGVQGAIRFLETRASEFADRFNIVVAPCVSPWGYETINRWNPEALDPNRSFFADSPAPESARLMRYLESLPFGFSMHIDLHETTDTDNTEFRPALAARDAEKQDKWDIPDGFYLVGDSERPAAGFQKAIIESVEKTTHIAPPDADGKIIGEPLQQQGVINYAARSLGLCMGVTAARYVTTTEVYPDSPRVDAENCIQAQVAAVCGGLEHIGAHPA